MGVSDIWRGRQGPAAGVVLRAAHIYCAHAAAPTASQATLVGLFVWMLGAARRRSAQLVPEHDTGLSDLI